MDFTAGNFMGFGLCRILFAAGVKILLFSLILDGAGCMIVPVPSVTPDSVAGVFDEATLVSLTGLDQNEVMRRIGWPDYFGPRGKSYVMVYQGEKRYSTDVYFVVIAPPERLPPKVSDGESTLLYCQVLELDGNGRVRNYDVIARPTRGVASRNDSGNTLADCSEVVWTSDERKDVLKRAAILGVQAEAGDRAAAVALAQEFNDLTYLKALVQLGDMEAARELIKLTGEPADVLPEAAESDDLAPAILIARHANELGPLRLLAESGNNNAVYTLLHEFDDQTYVEILAQNGNYFAAHELAQGFGETRYLRELAYKGNIEAASELARWFDEIGPLRELAYKGNTKAASELARRIDEVGPLVEIFKNDHGEAAYRLYEFLSYDATSILDAWRWLCISANSSNAAAQMEVGHWHRTSVWKLSGDARLKLLQNTDIRPNDRVAYMWYTLAGINGNPGALELRRYISEEMTPAEIAQAKQMARDWKPGNCPSAEHRLGPPGETWP